MKFYLCLVGILLALVQVNCGPPEEMKKLHEECEKEIGVTKEMVHGQHDDPKVKCFHACVMKKKDTLVDGKMVADKVIEHLSKHGPDGEKKDAAKAAATECATKANEQKEECEVAAAFHDCFMEKVHPH